MLKQQQLKTHKVVRALNRCGVSLLKFERFYNEEPPITVVCKGCSSKIQSTVKPGRLRQFCSETCRVSWWRRKQKHGSA